MVIHCTANEAVEQATQLLINAKLQITTIMIQLLIWQGSLKIHLLYFLQSLIQKSVYD